MNTKINKQTAIYNILAIILVFIFLGLLVAKMITAPIYSILLIILAIVALIINIYSTYISKKNGISISGSVLGIIGSIFLFIPIIGVILLIISIIMLFNNKNN
ncbi:hypothetical protein DY124_07550 [Apilactobacillus micheneri]|uniref:hypothetical protein n=1 Tax=Apilactobacillus micheneri TaxID=1899430 RepID=UPI00112723C1|nr:hypothetical protein [Apilactobacillus micheneri]TPR42351.1 hypothetical protein DY124_07550 [Apilactobacillus micheneri]TPR47072.1 hypothetical protein DY125_07480 [Apilactobacillus micheneri]